MVLPAAVPRAGRAAVSLPTASTATTAMARRTPARSVYHKVEPVAGPTNARLATAWTEFAATTTATASARPVTWLEASEPAPRLTALRSAPARVAKATARSAVALATATFAPLAVIQPRPPRVEAQVVVRVWPPWRRCATAPGLAPLQPPSLAARMPADRALALATAQSTINAPTDITARQACVRSN
jgi:hypothetical protein